LALCAAGAALLVVLLEGCKRILFANKHHA
jgi:hypothetical protein